MEMTKQLVGLERCPHCGVAHPTMTRLWATPEPLKGATHENASAFAGYMWAAYACATCGGVVTVKSQLLICDERGRIGNSRSATVVEDLYPSVPRIDAAIPQRASTYLQQAIGSLHAPDGAAMLAASAVDAMLKAKGYSEGSLYTRIRKAAEDHTITPEMAEWAHQVRLEANDVRHADEEELHKTVDQARQTVEFARALGEFMFALPARVRQGLEAAKSADKQ